MEAVIQTLEEENPPYDPRTQVNLEASKLFWGSKEDKKEYNKKLRRLVAVLSLNVDFKEDQTNINPRAVQRSMDYM